MPSQQLRGLDDADLLSILSNASDLGVGLPPQHGVRACYIGVRMGDQLGLSRQDQIDVCHAELLKDSGCTAWTTQIAAFFRSDEIAARREILFEGRLGETRDVMAWAMRHMAPGSSLPVRALRMANFALNGRDFMREGFQSAGEVARRIAQRMGASGPVQNALPYLFEQWDGKGMPLGLRGEAIPLLARIVFPSSYLEVAHRAGGRDAALRLARDRRGHAFDPAVVDAFEALSRRGEFWEPLETGAAWPTVRALLPDGNSSGPDEFAACCADFVDMKSFWLAGHSRRVADLSERLAKRLRFAEDDLFEIRFASLIHDLGLVAIPSFVLNKSIEQHTLAEANAIQQHGETVSALLSRFGALQTVSEIAGAHHRAGGDESNGHKAAETVSTAAHVISLASRYDALTHDGPGTRGLPPDQAIATLTASRDAEPRTDVAHVLGDEFAGTSSSAVEQGLPRGLTRREAEVLRHLARGLNRRQIAETLVVSESTVRAHLEDIYTKIGVSTNVGAVLFAMENGLTS